MSNRNKATGVRWENAVVELFRTSGWPIAERRALHGANDKGDVVGVPLVVAECKAAKTLRLGEWLAECDAEIVNADADTGAVWVKRHGKASAADGFVVLRPKQYLDLLREAGY